MYRLLRVILNLGSTVSVLILHLGQWIRAGYIVLIYGGTEMGIEKNYGSKKIGLEECIKTRVTRTCLTSSREQAEIMDPQCQTECLVRHPQSQDPIDQEVLFPALDAAIKAQITAANKNLSQGMRVYKTVRSLQLEVLGRCFNWAYVTLDDLRELQFQVPVHATCAEELAKLASRDIDDALLAQTFAPRDRLARIVNSAARRGESEVDRMLAVDGLLSGTHSKPVYDLKRYVDRLRYGLRDGEEISYWSRRDEDERVHVTAVRAAYDAIQKQNPADTVRLAVYLAVRRALKCPDDSSEVADLGDLVEEARRAYEAVLGHCEKRIERLQEKFLENKSRAAKKRKTDYSDEEDVCGEQ